MTTMEKTWNELEKMTDKERTLYYMTKAGFEPSEIGLTVQWNVADGRTIIKYFDEDGNFINVKGII